MWNKKDYITVIIVLIFIIGTGLAYLPIFESSAIYTKNLFYIIIGVIISAIVLLNSEKLLLDVTSLTIATSLFLLYSIVCNNGAQEILFAYLLITLLLIQVFFNITFSWNALIFAVKISALVMMIICLLQLNNLIPSNSSFTYHATFDNPSGVSIFLSICFSFMLSDYFKKHKLSNLLLLASILITIIFIPSRSGIVSIMAVGVITFLVKKTNRISKTAILSCIIVICGLFISLLWFKSDSSLGRLFIYGLSMHLGADNFLFGHGYYGFSANYMNYQANYFMAHPDSRFADLADETMHPLNEFLNLFISNGIIGISLFLFIVWNLYKKWNFSNLDYYGCLLVISIQSLFTYTFRYPFVWFFILLCISQITRIQYRIYPMSLMIRSVFLLLCIYISYITLKDSFFEYQWHKLAKGTTSNIIDYQKLSTSWNGNPFFLYNYAAVLFQHSLFEQSNQQLQKYEKFVNDYYAHIMMANNYYALETYDSARINYEKASWMCPARFIPLRGLLRTYKKTNDKEKTDSIAHYIINKNPKVKSYTVSIIKAETNKHLNHGKGI